MTMHNLKHILRHTYRATETRNFSLMGISQNKSQSERLNRRAIEKRTPLLKTPELDKVNAVIK